MELDILVEHIHKSFGENHVLDDFNLQLKNGENLAVVGKSGSGKSVLIKCIIGLLKPETGKIIVLGKEVTQLNQIELDKLRMKIGFLFQSNALYDSMTVKENLEFPLRRHENIKTNIEVDELIKEVLENVGLLNTINMMPAELSGGMKKRIALARTLVMKPKIILYDEPTTGLDPITAKEISKLIVDMQQHYKISSIIISHDVNCIKITSNRIILLINGKNYSEGTYEDFIQSNDEQIKKFFG